MTEKRIQIGIQIQTTSEEFIKEIEHTINSYKNQPSKIKEVKALEIAEEAYKQILYDLTTLKTIEQKNPQTAEDYLFNIPHEELRCRKNILTNAIVAETLLQENQSKLYRKAKENSDNISTTYGINKTELTNEVKTAVFTTKNKSSYQNFDL